MANDNQKTWSYAEITRIAEERIKQSMARRAKSSSQRDQLFDETLAFGIYIGWDSLTHPYQKPGDKERLEKLTDPS